MPWTKSMYFLNAFDTNYIAFNVFHAFNAQMVICYEIKAMSSKCNTNISMLWYENSWINDLHEKWCSMYSDTRGLLTARP